MKDYLDPQNLESTSPEGDSKNENESDEPLNYIYYEDLINLIIKYYSVSEFDSFLDGDEWKRSLSPPSRQVPEELDEMVKQSFIKKIQEHL